MQPGEVSRPREMDDETLERELRLADLDCRNATNRCETLRRQNEAQAWWTKLLSEKLRRETAALAKAEGR